jgi:hypothetical protein
MKHVVKMLTELGGTEGFYEHGDEPFGLVKAGNI